MSIRGLIVVLLLAAALGLAWQKREPLQAWAGSASLPATPGISFNEARPAADAAMPTGASRFRSGDLRKCVNGQQVSYSNVECPPGHKEQAVTAAPVTVLPATPVSKPAAASSGPSSLHKALDLTRDDTLREKAIERAVNGSR
jgi:hypothetical protein